MQMLINNGYMRALAEGIQVASIGPSSIYFWMGGLMGIPSLMLLILSFQDNHGKHTKYLGFRTSMGIFFVDLIYTGVLFGMLFISCPKASQSCIYDYYEGVPILGGILCSVLFLLYMVTKIIQKWRTRSPHTFSWLSRGALGLSLVYAMMPTTIIYWSQATAPIYALPRQFFLKILIPESLFKCAVMIVVHLAGNLLKVLCISWISKLKTYPTMGKKYIFKTAIMLSYCIQLLVVFLLFRMIFGLI